MKIIHTSDVHLDSPLTARLSSERIRGRKRELLATFEAGVATAKARGACAYIIAGDLFDSEKAAPATVDRVLATIEDAREITFFYLFGNHERDMLTRLGRELPENLKTFGDGWTYFDLGGVCIAGRCKTERDMFQSLELSAEKKNVVVLHGELGDRSGEGGVIGAREAAELPIDYLALGHYHTYGETKISPRCTAVYCGTPEGRGFDEAGKKGVVLIDTDAHGVRHEFIPTAKRTLHIKEVDISGHFRGVDAERCVEAALSEIFPPDLVRLVLTGERELGEEVNIDALVHRFKDRYYYFEVKDATRVHINAEIYKNDKTLKGEFIRCVLASCEIADDKKEKVISMGLAALLGESID